MPGKMSGERKMKMSCKINKRDSKLRNRDGYANLVARYRRTRKGTVLTDVTGKSWGGEGVDGSDYYSIRIGSDGVLYCSCPDYKFRGFRANSATGTNYICKHVRAFLARAARMIDAGVSMDSECIIYNEAVTVAAIAALGSAAAAGQKSGRRVA